MLTSNHNQIESMLDCLITTNETKNILIKLSDE
jgi:hypothetical protein